MCQWVSRRLKPVNYRHRHYLKSYTDVKAKVHSLVISERATFQLNIITNSFTQSTFTLTRELFKEQIRLDKNKKRSLIMHAYTLFESFVWKNQLIDTKLRNWWNEMVRCQSKWEWIRNMYCFITILQPTRSKQINHPNKLNYGQQIKFFTFKITISVFQMTVVELHIVPWNCYWTDTYAINYHASIEAHVGAQYLFDSYGIFSSSVHYYFVMVSKHCQILK